MAPASEKIRVEEVDEEEIEEVEEVEEVEEIEEEVEEEEEEGGEGDEAMGLDNVDSAGQQASEDTSAGKLFVGGIAWETTEAFFNDYFRKYGEIVDSVLMMDKHTKKPRGFGFVTFADPSVIDKVLKETHVIHGRTVEVKRTIPKGEVPPSKGGIRTKKVFIGGIPTTLTQDELKEHFSAYGNVVDHQILMDHNSGRSRGFAFVTYESEDSVDKLLSEGRMHDLNGKQVEIKKAEPKKAGDSVANARQPVFAGGNAYGGMYGGGNMYGYGSGHRSGGAGMYYGGRVGGGGYARSYGYGVAPGYGAAYAAQMYGAGAYGGANGYGGYTGGGYGAYGTGRGYGSRYHPYGR